MPDKDGDDKEKSTKSVVNKKQKQMMNTEEFSDKQRSDMKDILNKNFGSEDKSKETAGKLIKDKAKKDVERVQGGKQPNKSTPSTKLGRSKVDLNKYFGEEGYDIARDMGRVRPSKDKKDATTMPQSKKSKRKEVKGDTPMQKEFKKKYGKKATALDAVKQEYKGQIMKVEELDLTKVAEAFGGYIVEQTIGPKPNVSDQYTKAMRKNVKRGEKILDKLKSFNDPEADKQRTDAENDPDLEKIGQQETGKKRARRKGVDYFFDPDEAKKERANLIAKRKEYGIDRKGNISDAGVKRYAQKTKELASGSNMPVTPTKKELDIAKIRAVGTGEKGTDVGKYGGRLGRKRGKNQPSLADVKADIDQRNPTYLSPIKTKGKDGEMKNRPLPFPTRKSSYKSFTDKVLDDIERVKQAGPEKQKEIEDKLRAIPDDPRIRIGDVSGDRIIDKPVMDKKGEPVIDPKTKEPKTTPTEVTASGRTKPFGTLARRAEKAQRTTKTGALTGLAIKTLSPASAGLEAAERLRRGETGMAALSAVQALNIPVVSQAAGVVNALKTYQRGQQATPEPQPKADSGGKGGGKNKKPVATSGGKRKEPTPTGDGVGADLDTLQLRQLGQRLPEVGDKLKRFRLPKLVGGMAGRRSAQGGGAA